MQRLPCAYFVHARAKETETPGGGSEWPGYAVKLLDLPHVTAVTVTDRTG